ncbi:MAG TPA: hypothetical protein VGY48_18740 [Vicinamibacterales bacterium]|nr:hypothetical protein [Vicinamibacterales bacterium]
MRRVSLAAAAIALLTLAWHGSSAAQSLTYNSGQTVSPGYEGWEENPDGSFNFLFGYMNRNWQEELDVPVGPENNLEPGGPDLGQPTHFLPRRNRFVFKVHVPKDWGDKEMVWTLTTRGKTQKAYGTLRLDSKVDDVVKASETGALGAGTSSPEVRANKPPVVKLDGERQRNVKVGQPLPLIAWVTDDGVPKRRGRGDVVGGNSRTRGSEEFAKLFGTRNPAMIPPSRATVGKVVGLHLSWFVYRGSGTVKIDPPQVEPWEDTRTGANSPWAPLWTPPELPADGKWTATATFDEPGTYVLCARADDGALVTDAQVTVTVTP